MLQAIADGQAQLSEIPLSDLQPENRQFQNSDGWCEDETPPVLQPFEDASGGKLHVDVDGDEALDFVKLFLTDTLIDLFVTETNDYANKKN